MSHPISAPNPGRARNTPVSHTDLSNMHLGVDHAGTVVILCASPGCLHFGVPVIYPQDTSGATYTVAELVDACNRHIHFWHDENRPKGHSATQNQETTQ